MIKILLIEDNIDFSTLVKKHLAEKYLCLVDVASNQKEAYEFLKDNKYKFVFVDLHLKDGMNGGDIVQLVHFFNRDSKFYVFTHYDDDYIKNSIKGFEHLFSGVVKKMNMRESFERIFEK